jgi:hypothetical protein
MAVTPPILSSNQDTMLPFGGAMEPPGTPESPEPQVNPAPAQAQSILGGEVPPGQPIPADKMNEAGKKEFHETMRGFEQRDAANRGAMLALDPSDPDYLKKLGAHQAQEGMLKSEQAHFQKMHPWGSQESAHPGVLGKIGHVASEIGQVAGSAVAPGVVASIPGTQANLGGKVAAGQAEENQGAGLEEKAAQTGEQEAVASEAPSVIEKNEAAAKKDANPTEKTTKPEPVFDKAGNIVGFNTGTDLLGIHNPKLTPDMRDIVGAVQPKADKPANAKEDLQRQIVEAQNAGNAAEVKRLQGELKAIDPEGAERIGISLKGLGDRESTAADKKNKPYEDILDQAEEAREFARNPSPTNDFGLLMDFIGVTKPESVGKLRLNQNEIKLVLGTRSSYGDLEALGERIANGQMLTPKQRTDMLNTIGIMEGHAKTRLSGQGSGTTTAPAANAPPVQGRLSVKDWQAQRGQNGPAQ